MKLVKRILGKIASFCSSIYQFPVETALCLFTFVLIVALFEMEQRKWLVDGYFYKRFAPVSLLYVMPVFAIAFSIREGWKLRTRQLMPNVFYWLSPLLVVIPQFFFSLEDFFNDFLPPVGIYLLSFLLVFTIRGKKDNHLFVSDAFKLASSFATAVFLSSAVAIVYYAVSATVFYLFLPDNFSWKLLVCRILFCYVGFFVLVVITPLVFCYCAKIIEDKNAAIVPKALDVVLVKILTPALVCYAFILFLYAAKIVAAWSLPRGGVAWMVMAFLIVAFLVYMLQPFLSKTRFSFLFRYLPFISVVPLALYWVGIVRRISDYGLTESRVFLLAFGFHTTLFVVFTLSKRLNSYLLMSGLAAVTVFLLTLVPATSARSLSVANQQKRVEEFLAKYPIYNETTKEILPEAEIPVECLMDTVGRERFVSALSFLNNVDTTSIRVYNLPICIRSFSDPFVSFASRNFIFQGNVSTAGYPYMNYVEENNDKFLVDGKVVFEFDEEAYMRKNRPALVNACAENGQLPEDLFYLKNDSVMVILGRIHMNYCADNDSIKNFWIDAQVLLSKKPISKAKNK